MGDTIRTVKRKPVNRLRYFLRSAFLLQIFLAFQVHVRDFIHPFVLVNFLEYIYVLLLC